MEIFFVSRVVVIFSFREKIVHLTPQWLYQAVGDYRIFSYREFYMKVDVQFLR